MIKSRADDEPIFASRQQSPNPACAFARAAQIIPTGVSDAVERGDCGELRVEPALLDDEVAVVDVADFFVGQPGIVEPDCLDANATAHLAVVDENALRGFGDDYLGELIFVVVGE